MGWVRRPWSSSQKSLLSASSATVYWAKKPGSTRRAVASAATAFTPFSQNSKAEWWLRSGQAQPGQSKPPGWLAESRVLAPLRGMSWRSSVFLTLLSAPQPPAGPL